jgi:hypothetical protein
MREIKFRGKAKCIHSWSGYNNQYMVTDGQIVYGSYCKDVFNDDDDSSIDIHFIRIEYCGNYVDIEVDPETVGQYTSKKDTKGIEIYGSDKITWRCSGSIIEGVVCWANDGWFVKDIRGGNVTRLSKASTISVICNIYENPELLEDK